MKKIYLALCGLIATITSFAQTVPGGDMETWRTGTSGSISAIPVEAPAYWFGMDSLVIADGQEYIPTFFGHTPTMHKQVWQENTIIHGGTSSAKLMTRLEDTLGFFPGILSNAQASINVLSIIGGGSPSDALTYTGGTAVTLRTQTVSAWVEYIPGLDSGTHVMGGHDTAMMTVEAHGTVHGTDSILGVGTAFIPPSASFTQITATVFYTDTFNVVNNVRILFFSSGGALKSLDSSTLYVDDVTMTGGPQVDHTGVKSVTGNNSVKVYPNPATDNLYVDAPQNAGSIFRLITAGGQTVKRSTLTGNDVLDVSGLAGGIYFYTITDKQGTALQSGRVTLNR